MQIKNQARLYFAEAKWLHEAYTPGMDEYMRVASASVGNTLVWVISLVGMGDIVTKEAFEWVNKYPKILRASNVMFRLMDDIAGNKVCMHVEFCKLEFQCTKIDLSRVYIFPNSIMFAWVFCSLRKRESIFLLVSIAT